MMFRALAIAALTCLPLPAAAQDMPLVDHVAAALIGLQTGYHAYLGGSLTPVNQLGPGVFEVAYEGEKTQTTTITELEPCVFDYAVKIGTRNPRSVQFQMNSLAELAHSAEKTDENGMSLVYFNAIYDPPFVVRDREPIDAKFLLYNMRTDIPIASLAASAAALKAACPYQQGLPGNNG